MQAHQTAQTFSHLHQTQQKLTDCLNAAGSVVLSQEGRVQFITQKAETLLKRYFNDITYLGHGLPDRLKQWVKHQRIEGVVHFRSNSCNPSDILNNLRSPSKTVN